MKKKKYPVYWLWNVDNVVHRNADTKKWNSLENSRTRKRGSRLVSAKSTTHSTGNCSYILSSYTIDERLKGKTKNSKSKTEIRNRRAAPPIIMQYRTNTKTEERLTRKQPNMDGMGWSIDPQSITEWSSIDFVDLPTSSSRRTKKKRFFILFIFSFLATNK